MTYSERDLVGVFFKPITACLFTTSEKAGAGIHRPARSRHQRTQARACGRQRMGDRNGNAGGIPRRGIYDNMKTAVDRIRPGNVREVSEMVSYYLF